MKPTVPEVRARVPFSVRTAPTAPAIVISRPSRTQATPRAITILVWNGAHGSRSMRAGITLRITPPVDPPRPTAALLAIRKPPRRNVTLSRNFPETGSRNVGNATAFRARPLLVWTAQDCPGPKGERAALDVGRAVPTRAHVCPS